MLDNPNIKLVSESVLKFNECSQIQLNSAVEININDIMSSMLAQNRRLEDDHDIMIREISHMVIDTHCNEVFREHHKPDETFD